MMPGGQLEHQGSRGKRRRLSERRRLFGRLSGVQQAASSNTRGSLSDGSSEYQNRSDSPTSQLGSQLDSQKISMKIQFHITVAPDDEPLILDSNLSVANEFLQATKETGMEQLSPANWSSSSQPTLVTGSPRSSTGQQSSTDRRKSTDSIGEHINERLNRQGTLSTRRRQQLLAMHELYAREAPPTHPSTTKGRRSENNIVTSDFVTNGESGSTGTTSATIIKTNSSGTQGKISQIQQTRDGVRSSTVSGCSILADEATMRLIGERKRLGSTAESSLVVETGSSQRLAANISVPVQVKPTPIPRELIYFKRDGQRFGHEFTLKLATSRSYRCLLKIRPLIPLQAISIQGHSVLFVDCSHSFSSSATSGSGSNLSFARGSGSGSAPASWTTLTGGAGCQSNLLVAATASHTYHAGLTDRPFGQRTPLAGNGRLMSYNSNSLQQNYQYSNHRQNQFVNHRQPRTSHQINLQLDSFDTRADANSDNIRSIGLLSRQQQQQRQMMRHFAASHCSLSSSNSHLLGSQLIYMFDWSASRFEVNKNKARTVLQINLKFKNGQFLSLPLQVKFYESGRSRQHLEWGSQLHFIDYECSLNNLGGQISVNKVQYY